MQPNTRTEGREPENPGRRDLEEWRAQKPTNFFDSNPNLRATLAELSNGAAPEGMLERLNAFGAIVAGEVEALVAEYERPENLPVLRRWSGIGERIEQIDFHPGYIEAGRRLWSGGVLSVQAEPGHALEQAVMVYLLCHLGEGGHACPVACTAGLIKALQTHGSKELRARFLPPLLDPRYDSAELGAQFLTEVQGGSDVGANRVVAEPIAEPPPGESFPPSWAIHGEKWFCSVANADQFLLTARVPGAGGGTGGLGTFLIPRRLPDGTVNNFTIRRLKTKLGTRSMASAEIDFSGALAYAIGSTREGFKVAAGVVLNTSRWINALGSTGVMRRAYLEASSYARHRQAFGGSIGRFALVRETLATMKCEEQAALASTLFLSVLIDRLETTSASPHEEALYRFVVNANKFITSLAASDVTHAALEVFGGNGAIEDFSPIPRLLRDNLVFESWEGTHNVLTMQVLRDCARLGLFANVHDEVASALEDIDRDSFGDEVAVVRAALDKVSATVARSIGEPAYGAAHFRRQLTLTMRIFQSTLLLREACARTEPEARHEKRAVAAFFIRRHLDPTYEPGDDPRWTDRIDQILGDEVPLP